MEFYNLDEAQFERATKMLAGIPAGVQRAVGSALKRAADHGLTVGMKHVSKTYSIGQNELKRYTRHINTVVKDGATSVEVRFGYRGHVIPLIRFDTRFSNDGKVYTRTKRANTKQVLNNAFVAQINGHTGIFERLGPSRFPIEEKFGPSAVQALDSILGTRGSGLTESAYETEIKDEFDKRIEHEITRILNGWGK